MDTITPYTDVTIYQQPSTTANAATSLDDIASSVQNTIDNDNLTLVNAAAENGEDLIHNQGAGMGYQAQSQGLNSNHVNTLA